jgi:hypothetical protein
MTPRASRRLSNFLATCWVVLLLAREATSFQAKNVRQSGSCSPLSSMICASAPNHSPCRRTHLFSSSQEEQGENFSPSSRPQPRKPSKDYELEETLLRVHLSVRPSSTIDEALERVSKYTCAFPFAAVLPVQPLTYLPTTDGGVEVTFLRKKTQEKGSIDGGIRFFIGKERDGIEIVAKRNSDGQTVSKMFSEKQVVQAYVKGISGEEVEKTGEPPIDVISLDSVFHKWMQLRLE